MSWRLWTKGDRHRLAHELVEAVREATPGPPEAVIALLDAALICSAVAPDGRQRSIRERVDWLKQGLDLTVQETEQAN